MPKIESEVFGMKKEIFTEELVKAIDENINEVETAYHFNDTTVEVHTQGGSVFLVKVEQIR